MPLTQGQHFNERYWIAELIERGGFGAVYKAWDITLNRPVAIKESYEDTAEGQRQFLHEAQLLANLAHPNLPRVIDYFALAGQGQYLVMEFVDGQTLEELRVLNGGTLPEGRTLVWMTQVLEALSYIHGQEPPVIHRDIKPLNIKITPADKVYPQGRAMLVDFGVAKAYDAHKRTTIGARAVTPGFSPYEQYGQASLNTDARTDIYSLGATLYMLLTGQEPPESVSRLLRDPLISPRQLNPALSAQIEAAILKAMHNDPDLRFQTAEEFKAAISGLLSVTPPPPLAAATPIPPAAQQIPPPQPPVGVIESPSPQPATQPVAALPRSPRARKSKAPVSPPQTAAPAARGEMLAEKSPPRDARLARSGVQVFAEMQFMPVPGGKFLMGSRQDNDLGFEYEKPQHTVEIAQDTWLGRFPVTNTHFEKFIKATGQKHEWIEGWVWKREHPVVNVSWHAAMTYCQWLNQTCGQELPAGYIYRLPTEAEWEKAARGELGFDWPWGNDFDPTRCNSLEGNKGDTTPVGAYSPHGDSPYGCADMVGNVWEWTCSLWGKHFFELDYSYPYDPTDGRENFKASNDILRVLRGGSFLNSRTLARCASRYRYDPSYQVSYLGFRVGVMPPISTSGR